MQRKRKMNQIYNRKLIPLLFPEIFGLKNNSKIEKKNTAHNIVSRILFILLLLFYFFQFHDVGGLAILHKRI